MQIVPFEPSHIGQLLNYGGQEHLVARFGAHDLSDLIRHGHALTGVADGQIIACSGLVEATPYRAVAWALLSRGAPRHFLAIHRAVLSGLRDSGYRRIEAFVDPRSAAAMRWIALLGFRLERAYLPYHFPDGAGASAWVLYPKGR